MLGLIHTQNRPDRDRYITINEDAIDRKSKDQYMPKCYNCQTYDLPYECDSVMHYGWMDFAAAGRLLAFFRPTMTAKHPSCHLTSDGGIKPTEADWEMARRAQVSQAIFAYPCLHFQCTNCFQIQTLCQFLEGC